MIFLPFSSSVFHPTQACCRVHSSGVKGFVPKRKRLLYRETLVGGALALKAIDLLRTIENSRLQLESQSHEAKGAANHIAKCQKGLDKIIDLRTASENHIRLVDSNGRRLEVPLVIFWDSAGPLWELGWDTHSPWEVVDSQERANSIFDGLEQKNPFWRGDYLFGSHWWELTRSERERFIAPEDLKYLFFDTVDKDRLAMERLKRRFDSLPDGAEQSRKREPIPEDVRIFVWRRDEGKCVRCGSSENLEFDHIIPFSLGGSATTRNIQLLCEPCNRSKGAKL